MTTPIRNAAQLDTGGAVDPDGLIYRGVDEDGNTFFCAMGTQFHLEAERRKELAHNIVEFTETKAEGNDGKGNDLPQPNPKASEDGNLPQKNEDSGKDSE